MDTHRTCSEPECERRAVHIGPFCGEHMRTRRYHEWRALPQEEKFWARVDRGGPDECWPWFGAILPSGYGQMMLPGKVAVAVHRYSFELLVGPIPEGLVIDHVCHTVDPTCRVHAECLHRLCCNPSHMEPVTALENQLRGRGPAGREAMARTHCKRGHDLTNPANWKPIKGRPGARVCRLCVHIHRRDRYLRLGK